MDWIPCDTREPTPPPQPPQSPQDVRIVHSRPHAGEKPKPARGNTERLEKIRRRKRMRHLRAAVICAVLLAFVLAGFAGVYGASLTLLGDLMDAVAIALTPGPALPAPFTLSGFRAAAPLSGGFAAVGKQDLVLYSAGCGELRRIQHGFSRADITTGKTRVCVYNRAGKELRVESRSRTLFEQKYESAIQLCAMSPNGTLAVFTKSRLVVYDPTFEEIYNFYTQDLPTALAFCSDNRQLAAGCPYAENGALGGTVYLMHTGRDEYVTIRNTEGLPLRIQYLSGSEVLVIYDTFAARYRTDDGTELSRYGYDGRTLQSAAVNADGCAALLFGNGAQSAGTQLVLLDARLAETGSAAISERALTVAAGRENAFVLGPDAVLRFSLTGTPEETLFTEEKPLAVLAQSSRPLLLTQGTARALTQKTQRDSAD